MSYFFRALYTYIVGTTDGEFEEQTKMGEYDIFVAKYDKNGNKIWIIQYGTSTSEFSRANAISIDQDDNIYLAGWTENSLEGNSHIGKRDAFLTKLDTDGNRVWTKQFGSIKNEIATDILCDNANNIYVTGTTENTVSENNLVLTRDIFISKFDSSGVENWTKKVGTTADEDESHIISNNNNEIYITGSTNGDLNGTNQGLNDIFLIKLK